MQARRRPQPPGEMRSDPRSFPALQATAQPPACAKRHESVALSAKRRSYAHHLFAPGLNQQPLLRIGGIICRAVPYFGDTTMQRGNYGST